jgi:hypothetical protein
MKRRMRFKVGVGVRCMGFWLPVTASLNYAHEANLRFIDLQELLLSFGAVKVAKIHRLT